MSDMGKGDWVQCIDASGNTDLTEGSVYCIAGFVDPRYESILVRANDGSLQRMLPGCKHCETEHPFVIFTCAAGKSFCPRRFRPLGGNSKSTETKKKELELVGPF